MMISRGEPARQTVFIKFGVTMDGREIVSVTVQGQDVERLAGAAVAMLAGELLRRLYEIETGRVTHKRLQLESELEVTK